MYRNLRTKEFHEDVLKNFLENAIKLQKMRKSSYISIKMTDLFRVVVHPRHGFYRSASKFRESNLLISATTKHQNFCYVFLENFLLNDVKLLWSSYFHTFAWKMVELFRVVVHQRHNFCRNALKFEGYNVLIFTT